MNFLDYVSETGIPIQMDAQNISTEDYCSGNGGNWEEAMEAQGLQGQP
jgi:hypothetical protein